MITASEKWWNCSDWSKITSYHRCCADSSIFHTQWVFLARSSMSLIQSKGLFFFSEWLRHSRKMYFCLLRIYMYSCAKYLSSRYTTLQACAYPSGRALSHWKEWVNIFVALSHTMSLHPRGSQTLLTAVKSCQTSSSSFLPRTRNLTSTGNLCMALEPPPIPPSSSSTDPLHATPDSKPSPLAPPAAFLGSAKTPENPIWQGSGRTVLL